MKKIGFLLLLLLCAGVYSNLKPDKKSNPQELVSNSNKRERQKTNSSAFSSLKESSEKNNSAAYGGTSVESGVKSPLEVVIRNLGDSEMRSQLVDEIQTHPAQVKQLTEQMLKDPEERINAVEVLVLWMQVSPNHEVRSLLESEVRAFSGSDSEAPEAYRQAQAILNMDTESSRSPAQEEQPSID